VTFSDAFRKFAHVFGTAFAAFYVLAVARDVALFTVFPTLGIVVLGTQHPQDLAPAVGLPAMYWYGWGATAALGALVVAGVAAFLPARWTRWCWTGVWVVPAVAMLACVYLTLPWLRRWS
jgi:hypothetical protein